MIKLTSVYLYRRLLASPFFRRGIEGVVIFILTILFSPVSQAAIDPFKELISEDYPAALRWENVEGEPARLFGEKTHYDVNEKLHSVTLKNKQSISIHLNKNELLRIMNLDDSQTIEQLSFASSNTGILYALLNPVMDKSKKNLLIKENKHNNRIIRISNNNSDNINIAIFISRYDYIKRLIPYRDLLKLPLSSYRINNVHKHEWNQYWLMQQSLPFSVNVKGPKRLALHIRQQFNRESLSEKNHLQLTSIIKKLQTNQLNTHYTHLLTRRDSSNYFIREDKPLALSREEVVYIDIPEGRHELQLQSSQNSYIRLLALDEPDYLFPELNETPVSVAQARNIYQQTELNTDNVFSILTAQNNSGQLYNIQWIAAFIAMNNEVRDSSLDAVALLKYSLKDNKGLKEAGGFVETFRKQHTFYRDLMPYENKVGSDFYRRHFLLYSLRALNKRPTPYYMVDAYDSPLCQSLNKAYFFTVPESSEQVLSYYPGIRKHDLRLRLIVDKTDLTDNKLYIQFDDKSPLPIQISSGTYLPESYFNTSSAEACISRHSLLKNKVSKNNERYSAIAFAEELSNVAYTIFNLPANVSHIKIWKKSTSGDKSPLHVAVQYETAKSFAMSESDYLKKIKLLDKSIVNDYLLPVMNNKKINKSLLSKMEQFRLVQNWQALKLFLQSRKNLYFSGYKQPQPVKNSSYSSEQQIEQVYQAILLKRQQEQWLEIIELYASVSINPQYSRYLSIFQQFDYALEQSGEYNLREKILKGTLFYNKNLQLKDFAFTRLKKYYQENSFNSKLTQLLVVRTYASHSEADFRSLVIHLVNEGYNDFSLQLGLFLNKNNELSEKLLQAAFNEKKWIFFDYLLSHMEDALNNSKWQMLKALSMGDKNYLDRHFNEQEMKLKAPYEAELIAQIRTLYAALQQASEMSKPEIFTRQWREWSHWKLNKSMDKIWNTDNKLIYTAQGNVSVYNQERNLLHRYFRATEQQAVKLSVVGPVRLRFTVRLLYDNVAQETIKTSLILNDNGKKLLSSLHHSKPSQGLNINGQSDMIVGSIQYFEYEVGEGEHDIEYYAQNHSIITSLSTLQPALRFALLPDVMTPEQLSIISSGYKLPTKNTPKSFRQCLNSGCMMFYQDEYKQSLPRILAVENSLHKAVHRDAKKYSKLITDFSYSSDDDFFIRDDFNPAYFNQQAEQYCLLENTKSKLNIDIHSLNVFPSQSGEHSCPSLADKENRAIILLNQMAWYLNNKPEQRKTLELLAGSIIQNFSKSVKIRKLAGLFEFKSRWQVQSNVNESAGLHFKQVTGWQPVSAYARIRKALLSQHNESIILNNNRISGIRLDNNTASRLKISIKNPGFDFISRHELLLRYQLDNLKWKLLRLKTTDDKLQWTLSMPSGVHTFKIQWLNPLAGQYVSVDLLNIKQHQAIKLFQETERYYHIASVEEPVKLSLQGPARLRIEYLSNTESIVDYRYISKGWHKLKLSVISGEQDSLYRIYTREMDDKVNKTFIPPIDRNISALPFSYWYQSIEDELQAVELHSPIVLTDQYTLGNQEDGTQALGILWSEGGDREDNLNDLDTSDYYEYNFSHYYFVEDWQTYFDSKLLYRDHDSGEPTYGFEETVFSEPDWLPFAVRLDWKYYSQEYDSQKGNDRAWSTNTRLGIEQLYSINPKLSHLPKLVIFNKDFSNNGFNNIAYNKAELDIDYDVWNEYADIHDQGLIISDTLYAYPWLDTRISTGFSLYSDEDFRLNKPEHFIYNTGWLQMLDKFILNLDYRWTYYYAEHSNDWNRSDSSSKANINTNLFWESWTSKSNRLLANFKLSYDTKKQKMTATIGFNYYFDHGRGFRDFRPHSMSFRDLRERRRFRDVNNSIDGVTE